MQLTRTHIILLVALVSMTVIIRGIYLWYPWRQDVSITLPILSPGSTSPSRVETPYGNVQTDFTRIINPAEIETRITHDEYDDIEMGMSYEDIIDIVGGTGLVLNRTEAGGQVFAIYIYYGDERGANANLTFQNNKLINKTKHGLK